MQRSEIPLSARVELAHAEIQAVARASDVDALLVKGYALDPRLQHAGRHSTDVDLLVRPAHVAAMVTALHERGWETVSTFRTGSIFHHAQTMRHERWGLVDVHRSFPGFELSPGNVFDALWRRRTQRPVAAYPCDVPDPLDQALLLVVHAARSPQNMTHDVGHLARVLAAEDWRLLEHRADELGASVAFAAATGRLSRYRHRPTHDLWLVLSRDGTRSQEWRARMRAATTLRAKLRLVASAPLPNLDHLAMDLERRPTAAEVVRATAARPVTALRDLLTGRAALRSTQDGPLGPESHDAGTEDRTRVRCHEAVSLGTAPDAPRVPLLATGVDDVGRAPGADGARAGGVRDKGGAAPGARAGAEHAAHDAEHEPSGAARGTSAGACRRAEDVAVVAGGLDEADSRTTGPEEALPEHRVYLARVPGGAPLVLNDSAALVWQAAQEVPLGELPQAVAHAVGTESGDISEDVEDFVSYLVARGFLVPATPPDNPGAGSPSC